MAEVFGVVSGALSVGSLVVQIFDCVQQLQDFCKAVKNAPRDVVDVLEELELLAGTLLSLRADLDQYDFAKSKDRATQQSIDFCVRVGKDLELILMDLGKGMTRGSSLKRKWAMVKAATGGEKIQSHLKRLERAKSMLSLSIECLSLKLQLELRSFQGTILSRIEDSNIRQEQPIIIEKKFRGNNIAEGSRSISPIRRSPTYHGSQQKPYAYITRSSWRGPGIRSYKSVSQVSKDRHMEGLSGNDEYFIERTFLSTASFFRKGLIMTSVRSYGNWQYTFAPIRIILDTDPVWDACAAGDIETLKEYLQNGYSVHDSSNMGHTFLHVAGANARPKLCKWLLEQGAKANVTAGRFLSTPLSMTCVNANVSFGFSESSRSPLRISRNTRDRPIDICDCLRVLVEHGGCDPMVGNGSNHSAIHAYNGPPEGYEYLVNHQQEFMLDMEAQNLVGSRIIDAKFASARTAGFEIIRLTLPKLKIENHINRSLEHTHFGRAKSNIPSGCTLLHAAFDRMVNFYQAHCPIAQGYHLLEDLLKMGFDVHGLTRDGTTPLDFLLDYTYDDLNIWVNNGSGIIRVLTGDLGNDLERREQERDKSEILLGWMRVLRTMGISMHGYWKEEEKLHPGGLVGHCDYVRVGIDRFFSVEYEDNDEVIVKVLDKSVETEDFSVPGAWVEDDNYVNDDGLVVLHGVESRADWVVKSRTMENEKRNVADIY